MSNGGAILAPYQITRGSLPSISMAKNSSNKLVSSIALGSLSITATTTVAQFSQAVIDNNSSFVEGDQITFFHGIQMKAGVELNHDQFKDMVNSMLDDRNHRQEKEVYFYHSDHLGSASWITDFGGVAVQHIRDEFMNHDNNTGDATKPAGKIHYGESWESVVVSYNELSMKLGLEATAIGSLPQGIFDIKSHKNIAPDGAMTGKLLEGYYTSARSAGNFLAGLNGATARGMFGQHIS